MYFMGLQSDAFPDRSILAISCCWRKAVTVLAILGNRLVTDGYRTHKSPRKPYWLQPPQTNPGVGTGSRSHWEHRVLGFGWIAFPALPCRWTPVGLKIAWKEASRKTSKLLKSRLVVLPPKSRGHFGIKSPLLPLDAHLNAAQYRDNLSTSAITLSNFQGSKSGITFVIKKITLHLIVPGQWPLFSHNTASPRSQTWNPIEQPLVRIGACSR